MKNFYVFFLIILIVFCIKTNAQQFTLVNTDIIPAPYGEVQWGDFNDDGKLDVLISGYPYGDISLLIPGSPAFIYRNDENNKFVNINAPLDSSSYVKWIDVNNDNYLDIFLCDEKAVYLNLNGNFQKISLPITNKILSYDWGDYDRDGYNDLVVSEEGAEDLIIFKNDDGQFQKITTNIPNLQNSRVSFEDYNGDGYPDIFFAGYINYGGLVSRIYKNDGNGNFVETVSNLPFVPIAWSDMNNDGKMDALGVNFDSVKNEQWLNEAEIYLNMGNGNFQLSGSKILFYYTSDLNSINAKFGDFDNDGDMDLLIGSSPGAGFYINKGNNNFTEPDTGYWSSRTDMDWGDYDNDGDLDVILTGHAEIGSIEDTELWRNNSLIKNSPPTKITSLNSVVNSGDVHLTWGASSDDHTDGKALSYNVRISTTPGGADILSPMANPQSGKRYISAPGNAGTNKFLNIDNLKKEGKYYWSVQAIDGAYSGSPFSDEKSFTITNTNPIITSLPVLKVIVDSTYFYMVTAKDNDGDTLSYSIETNAHFLSINNNTGEISGKPTISDTGKFNVNVIVDDGKGGITEQTYTLIVKVNEPENFSISVIPLSIGNKWIYSINGSSNNLESFEVVSDTTLSGQKFSKIKFTSTVDTAYQYWKADSNQFYMSNSSPFASGIKYDRDSTKWKQEGIGSSEMDFLNFKNRKVQKAYTYYVMIQHIWTYTYITAEGFGIVEVISGYSDEVGGYSYNSTSLIRGAVIDGTVYGDTTIPPPKPPTPQLTGIAGHSMVELKWSRYKGNDFKVYNIFKIGNSADSLLKSISIINDTTLDVNDLENGISYKFKMNTENTKGGISDYSKIVSLKPLFLYKPELTGTTMRNSVELKWRKYNENDFKEYNIFETGNTSDSLLKSIEDIKDTTLIVDSLINGKTYVFKMNLENKWGGISDFSKIVSLKPLFLYKPELTGTTMRNSVELKWRKYNENDFKEYDIFETGNTSDSLLKSIEDIKDTTLIVSSLINGKTYAFKMNLKNKWGGISDFSEVVSFEIHINFSLYQNYPNPFNAHTTISYDLPADQFVIIKIYDITGAEVRTLVNKYEKAGSYNIDFNSGTLASGVYFYQIRAGKYVETRKMLLLK